MSGMRHQGQAQIKNHMHIVQKNSQVVGEQLSSEGDGAFNSNIFLEPMFLLLRSITYIIMIHSCFLFLESNTNTYTHLHD